ncbi:GntR family transcriptional regulator [Amycolatopsis jiangsuensis]|uniref:DNA-binding GntR family transcriptional regulator n=1 Tax=Amycolatopsis jiangsuensis TaxID=1181879 RepID=A0A840IRQ1_9PSEU|nr:GntR family transcriptional regulator [Amycolatopsis jiangsuensis]MBB4684513.1 DNA-binding GntR family transcriptional regulator [Amycolatopsis jiangsuensis]
MDGAPAEVAAAFRLALADGEVDPLANRTDRALAAIKRGILTGGLRPGQQLVEADIAEVLQMSKTPVREALKTLVGSGLVVLSRFKGAVVRELDAAAASAIYDLRLLLEPEAVRRAVANGADVSVAARALDRAVAAGESGDAAGMSLANREFHRALYLGCGNPLLISTLDGLKDQTALVSVSGWRSAGGWRDEAEEHRGILAAATKGDAAAAAAALHEHVTGFVERTIPLLTTETGEGIAAAG